MINRLGIALGALMMIACLTISTGCTREHSSMATDAGSAAVVSGAANSVPGKPISEQFGSEPDTDILELARIIEGGEASRGPLE